LVQVNNKNILIECGMFQGSHEHEKHNRDPFPFDVSELDAVIVSHAHLDHTGRLPMLIKEGFHGCIYTHNTTVDLCKIMLLDSGYIHEKEARWENKKRERKGLALVDPLYTRAEAETTCQYFKGLTYDAELEVCQGVKLTLRDAGHIIGSAIVELALTENGVSKKIVFSGDLGHKTPLFYVIRSRLNMLTWSLWKVHMVTDYIVVGRILGKKWVILLLMLKVVKETY
jgi:metallo-beta-lactamase family protein